MTKDGLVVCELPRSGLGNQLFPLMKALVFARLNNLPIIVTGYHFPKLGPYIRREKSKRNYSNYFTFQKNPVSEFLDKLKVWKIKRKLPVINNPALGKLADPTGNVYVFTARIRWNNFFDDLKEHRQLVKQIFWENISEKIKNRLNNLPHPKVGVHIRMGDFKQLQAGQKFRSVGGVRTPMDYFLKVIESIRMVHGAPLPVSVFSDGHRHELKDILQLPNVELIEGNPDIIDLLLLSRSKIIVASAGSTFSYWAGFLSDVPLILHPDHIHEPVRETNSGLLYEGPFDHRNKILKEQVGRFFPIH